MRRRKGTRKGRAGSQEQPFEVRVEELPDDAPRMSALLADIAEPMLQGLELPEQEDEFRAGLMLAAAVWNASTFRSRRRRRKALAAVKRMSDVPLPEEVCALCDQVFERARSRYPDEGARSPMWSSSGKRSHGFVSMS
jgi:hypothetical protein